MPGECFRMECIVSTLEFGLEEATKALSWSSVAVILKDMAW